MATRIIQDGKQPKSAKTRVIGPRTSVTRIVAPQADDDDDEATIDPVVGWLVIIGGPGRGAAVPVGYGMNSVGRQASNRIQVDFGDDGISGDNHFRIAYDARSRQFHIAPGDGANLVYLGGDTVLSPMPLTGGAELRVSDTEFRFVPFCGPDWDWGDRTA